MFHQFEYKNFKPNLDLKIISQQTLERILDLAPSDAATIAKVTKVADGFEATIEIFSKAGAFVAKSIERFPHFAIESAKRRMEQRLEDWRRARFSPVRLSGFAKEYT